MTTQRLDGPFAATRRYGVAPLPMAFDILTLPFQLSNTLTGVPPLEIPDFGPAAVAPGPAPTPVIGGGVQGSFGVEGLTPMSSGLGYQSVTVGAATFAAVRVTWTGLVQNTGNAPLSGATARLRTLSSPGGNLLRETSATLPTLAPGASAPLSLAVDLSSQDPPGSFIGALVVELAGQPLGQVTSLVLGTINPTSSISITGDFVV